MKIGVPRERKEAERRVAITPKGTKRLTSSGHSVLVETGAGILSGYTDEEFIQSGAKILPHLSEVWNQCDLLVKVKEPAPEEIPFFRPKLAVFSFLHLAVAPELTHAMVEKGVTGIDYDLVSLDNGRLTILEPMSNIAGQLSVQCGAYALQAGSGGKGILLGGSIGVPPGNVLVVGAGVAGTCAARSAAGLGAQVTVLDVKQEKLDQFASTLNITTAVSTSETLAREIIDADLVIGAVLIPGAKTPKLIKREMIAQMKPGSVFVDICIDQGGVSETSRPTTLSNPTYLECGVVHYCVTNMPALVPRTSTEALTNATLDWICVLAEEGIEKALAQHKPLQRALTSYGGHLTNRIIGEALAMKALDENSIGTLWRSS